MVEQNEILAKLNFESASANTETDKQHITEAVEKIFYDEILSVKTNVSKLKDATEEEATKVKNKVKQLNKS